MKCLMAIGVISMTGAQLEKLRQQQITSKHVYNFIPEYVLNDNNKIVRTEEWLQFGGDANTVYHFFDIEHTDQPLAEEINEVGYDDVFKDIDLSIVKSLPNQRTYPQLSSYGLTDYLVFDLEFESWEDGYNGGYEYETHTSLHGYLDKEKNIVRLVTLEKAA